MKLKKKENTKQRNVQLDISQFTLNRLESFTKSCVQINAISMQPLIKLYKYFLLVFQTKCELTNKL